MSENPDVLREESPLDVERVLLAPDGMDYWRRRMHSRCDPSRGIRCPWCEEFTRPSDE